MGSGFRDYLNLWDVGMWVVPKIGVPSWYPQILGAIIKSRAAGKWSYECAFCL